MVTSCTDSKHPYYKGITSYNNPLDFFRGKVAFHLKYVSLGEALDFVSFGGLNYVAWQMSLKNMVGFVRDWMRQQEPKLEYARIPTGNHSYQLKVSSRQFQYMWNKFPHETKKELPFIDRKECPRDKNHKGVLQLGSIKRCAHTSKIYMRPSFIEEYPTFDDLSGMQRTHFLEKEPYNPAYIDDENRSVFPEPEYSEYLKDIKRFESEKIVQIATNPCFAIISDKGSSLELETILSRISVGSHSNSVAFPFSGFTVADYVASWWNQPGKKQLFRKSKIPESYRCWPKFEFVSSDD